MNSLFSVPVSITSKAQALAVVSQWVKEYDRQRSTFNAQRSTPLKLITTPNPEMIVAAQSDPEFLKALQSADLSIPDGIGIIWALRILGPREKGQGTRRSRSALSPQPLAFSPRLFSRLSGLDFMEALIRESAKKGWKVMLLGGKKGVAEKAVEKLMHQIRPGLAKQGQAFIQSINGPMNILSISKSENDFLISRINSFSPDLLFVAFGHGKQERWLNVNRYRLNVGVAMGVGGAFDQIADPSLRPPAIINSIGLGWLYRLFREPWRWKRQLALIRFAGMAVRTLMDPSTLRRLADRSG